MVKDKKHWRINQQIHAPKVRVVGEKGQLGVMTVSEALKKAEQKGLDLIEIAPLAKPPVVKIEDFGKFRYREEKKTRKTRAKSPDLKEIRFSPFIGEADLDTRLKRINEFLDNGDKVRIVIKYKGRQMEAKKTGYDLLERIVDSQRERINIDMEPKFIGRHLAMVISPSSKIKKQEEEGKKNENKDEK